MNHEITETKEKKGGSKALTIIGIILCVILVPILVVNVTMIVKSYINPVEYPSFAGYSLMIVNSGSMSPAIEKDDLIIVKKSDVSEIHGETAEGKQDGTIISFFDPDTYDPEDFDPEKDERQVLTHRCVEVVTDENGEVAFKTKGDVNNAEDFALAPADFVIGTYVGRIPFVGGVAKFMSTTVGLIVFVGVPIILLVLFEIIGRKRDDKKKRKDTDALLAELAELRNRADSSDKPALETAGADADTSEAAAEEADV